jgi:hypothetical protein
MPYMASLDFMLRILSYILIISICINCSNGIEKRCAFIHIYNEETETETMSDLYVDVQSNKIIKIYWDNGGWLDETHFNPDDAILDSDGYTSFNDDRGRDFGVTLQKKSNCEYWNN